MLLFGTGISSDNIDKNKLLIDTPFKNRISREWGFLDSWRNLPGIANRRGLLEPIKISVNIYKTNSLLFRKHTL